jgi:hypothetical protein
MSPAVFPERAVEALSVAARSDMFGKDRHAVEDGRFIAVKARAAETYARPANPGLTAYTCKINETMQNACNYTFSTLSCSPFQAAGIEIPLPILGCSAWPLLGKAGGTIMKRRLIML